MPWIRGKKLEEGGAGEVEKEGEAELGGLDPGVGFDEIAL